MLFLFDKRKNKYINTNRIISVRHYKLQSSDQFAVEVELSINDLDKKDKEKHRELFENEGESLEFLRNIENSM